MSVSSEKIKSAINAIDSANLTADQKAYLETYHGTRTDGTNITKLSSLPEDTVLEIVGTREVDNQGVKYLGVVFKNVESVPSLASLFRAPANLRGLHTDGEFTHYEFGTDKVASTKFTAWKSSKCPDNVVFGVPSLGNDLTRLMLAVKTDPNLLNGIKISFHGKAVRTFKHNKDWADNEPLDAQQLFILTEK